MSRLAAFTSHPRPIADRTRQRLEPVAPSIWTGLAVALVMEAAAAAILMWWLL